MEIRNEDIGLVAKTHSETMKSIDNPESDHQRGIAQAAFYATVRTLFLDPVFRRL
jgi:hypothetical protein